jgi:hypothetical protein
VADCAVELDRLQAVIADELGQSACRGGGSRSQVAALCRPTGRLRGAERQRTAAEFLVGGCAPPAARSRDRCCRWCRTGADPGLRVDPRRRLRPLRAPPRAAGNPPGGGQAALRTRACGDRSIWGVGRVLGDLALGLGRRPVHHGPPPNWARSGGRCRSGVDAHRVLSGSYWTCRDRRGDPPTRRPRRPTAMRVNVRRPLYTVDVRLLAWRGAVPRERERGNTVCGSSDFTVPTWVGGLSVTGRRSGGDGESRPAPV